MRLWKRLDNPMSTPRALLRHWRARGLLRPALVLLVVLFVVLAEPLACILHCELHPSAAQHQHRLAASLRQRPFHPLMAPADVGALLASPNCFQAAGSAPSPAIPPSPVHELVLGLGLTLIGIAQIRRLGRPAPLPAPGMRRAPPTPPPRRPLPALFAAA